MPFRIYCQQQPKIRIVQNYLSARRLSFSSWKQTFSLVTNQRGETDDIMHVFYCGSFFLCMCHEQQPRVLMRERFAAKKSTLCDRTHNGFLSNNEWNGEDMVANQTVSANFAALLLAAIVCVSVSATRSCLKFCNITFQQTSATGWAARARRERIISTLVIKTRSAGWRAAQNEINMHLRRVEKK